jgi:tRNA-Thr(GGU) m(6)t(6)A37 methyltransferase TsaA
MAAGDPRRAPHPLPLRPIGVIRTRFHQPEGTPIQPAYAAGSPGEVVLDEEFEPALADLEGFERVWLVYWFDRAGPFQPRVVPYRDTQEHGLFATRAPSRPNPVGLSAVRLVRREGRVLHVADVDILDGTPLLDIKPYIPECDAFPEARAGWFHAGRADRRVADDRFHG